MNYILEGLLDFLNHTHSEFNAANNIREILKANGFIELDEKLNFSLERGKNYFVIRNDSGVIAFKIPNEIKDYNFTIASSHLDSPCLKLKMEKDVVSNGYHKLNVEKYGGLILSSWVDRPLSVAGRVVIENEGKLETKFIDIEKPLLIIPNVCIHFNRDINNGFKYNEEIDLKPIISLDGDENSILKELSSYLSVEENKIITYELNTYNFTKSYVGGLKDEFIMSPRIDNLESAYLSLRGFLESYNDNISVFAAFNNEEIGSGTYSGADGDFLKNTLKRISNLLGYSENEFFSAMARSFNLSIDNGHAVHPNHPELSDSNNFVYLNKGPIIKFNNNMAYMSDACTAAPIISLCKNNEIPFQIFYNKSDIRGGSTLGTLSNSQIGIRTCDIGCAQLAMHSSYETAGSKDAEYMYQLVKVYYSTKF